MKWKLDGNDLGNWDPTCGGFSGGNATTTWTDPESGDPNREFVTVAWADMNGDGLVDTDEPTRELEVIVVHACVTIYADQPVFADPDTVIIELPDGTYDVGHSFWGIDITPASAMDVVAGHLQDELNEQWGYYPDGGVDPKNDVYTAPAIVRNDTGHPWDARLPIHISERSKLVNILQHTHDLRATAGTYDLRTNNCTDQAIIAAGVVDVTLPDSAGTYYILGLFPAFTASCPAVFGEELVNAGGERNPGGGGGGGGGCCK